MPEEVAESKQGCTVSSQSASDIKQLHPHADICIHWEHDGFTELAASGRESSGCRRIHQMCPELIHPGDNRVVERMVWPQESRAYTSPQESK